MIFKICLHTYDNHLYTAFEIVVVRLPETTKTCAGQPKILLRLSRRQPHIYSKKSLFMAYNLY